MSTVQANSLAEKLRARSAISRKVVFGESGVKQTYGEANRMRSASTRLSWPLYYTRARFLAQFIIAFSLFTTSHTVMLAADWHREAATGDWRAYSPPLTEARAAIGEMQLGAEGSASIPGDSASRIGVLTLRIPRDENGRTRTFHIRGVYLPDQQQFVFNSSRPPESSGVRFAHGDLKTLWNAQIKALVASGTLQIHTTNGKKLLVPVVLVGPVYLK